MARTAVIIASAAVTVLAGVGAYVLVQKPPADAFASCREGQVAGGDIGGPFELISAAGETVTDVEVIDEPSLLYFGYTFCPDVCPLDVARNAVAVDILAEAGVAAQPVFISVDPGRDTPEVVGNFAANMHPKMVGLTGSPEQVRAASQTYRTYYQVNGDPETDPYYLVDHTTLTYLVLPEHGFVDFFRRDIAPQDLAETVSCFVNAAEIH